jgi:hypothetical protein
MHETWLGPNRRAIIFGCAPPLAVIGLGLWLALGPPGEHRPALLWVGVAMVTLGVAAVGLLVGQLRRPRIGYHNGQVLFYLQGGGPIAVPAHVVEAFFLGQGPAALPGAGAQQLQSVNLVARLAEREIEWAARDVKRALGQWCGGYVTIRGTWCEPLGVEVVRRLNRRLKEVQLESSSQ